MVFIGTEEMLADQKIVNAIVDFLYEKKRQGNSHIKAIKAELDDTNMRYKNILEILKTGDSAFEAFKERCSRLENKDIHFKLLFNNLTDNSIFLYENAIAETFNVKCNYRYCYTCPKKIIRYYEIGFLLHKRDNM